MNAFPGTPTKVFTIAWNTHFALRTREEPLKHLIFRRAITAFVQASHTLLNLRQSIGVRRLLDRIRLFESLCSAGTNDFNT